MNSLGDFFDLTFLINLPERVDRLKGAQREFTTAGWRLGEGGVRIFPAQRYFDRAGFPSAGVRGCFQSHLECLRQAQMKGCKNVLLLEDDVGFFPSLHHIGPKLKSRVQQADWDFIYFGHYGIDHIPDVRPNQENDEVRFEEWNGPIVSTYFYGVSNRIFAPLIERLELHAHGVEGDNEWGPMPIDGVFNLFRRANPDVRTLIANPKLGFQRSSRSDVTPGKLDRIPVIRALTDLIRTIRSPSR